MGYVVGMGGQLLAAAALVTTVLGMALTFGVRAVLLRRRTGSWGFNGISGRPGSPEWLGGVLFVVALLVLVLGLAAPLVGVLAVDELPTAQVLLGAVVVGLGLVGVWLSQSAMGDSWRVGVDHGARTALVTHGPFALVRNPIFTGIVLVSAGLVLLVPNVLTVLAVVALVVAVQLQVRVGEEPYLTRTVPGYADYAARTGRFVPGVGRLPNVPAEGSGDDHPSGGELGQTGRHG